MSCCGQKRQQWQQQMAQAQPAPKAPEQVLENPIPVQYNGSHSYLVKGPQTGLLYLFAAKGNSLMVDSRDASLLLADGQKFSLV